MWERSRTELNDYYSNEQPHRMESHQGKRIVFQSHHFLNIFIDLLICLQGLVNKEKDYS